MKAADLRKSILQAAVQGKLVPQNPHDEPATKLLERIRRENIQLIKEGKIKKEKTLLPISEEEPPFELPEGWVWCRLGEIAADISTGPFGSMLHKSDYVQDGIPLVNPVNMVAGKIVSSTKMMVSQKTKDKLASYVLNINDIVIARRGDLGRCAIVTARESGWICGTGSFILRLPTDVFLSYFTLFFGTPSSVGQLMKGSVGSTMNNLNHNILNDLLFPLPPLAEQQRIVVAVNGLMALCDELEAAEKELDTLESQFAEYLPKAILQAAVQGKLVPQNIHDEPADKLLERIRAEKPKLIKSDKLKKEKPLPPITEDEVPYDLPDGWAWCRLGDVCQVNPRNKLTDEIHVSFVPMTLISSDFFGGYQQEQRIWREVKSGFTHFAEGDIIIAKITPCFQNKKSCIVRGLKNGFGAGTTELHVLRPIHILPEYILIYAKSPDFLDDGVKNMTGTAGQQRVPTEFVRSAIIPLPPLAEQHRIVAKVNELISLCDALKAAHETPVGAPTAVTVIPFPHQEEEEPEMLMAARGAMPKAPSKALQDARNRLFED